MLALPTITVSIHTQKDNVVITEALKKKKKTKGVCYDSLIVLNEYNE